MGLINGVKLDISTADMKSGTMCRARDLFNVGECAGHVMLSKDLSTIPGTSGRL